MIGWLLAAMGVALAFSFGYAFWRLHLERIKLRESEQNDVLRACIVEAYRSGRRSRDNEVEAIRRMARGIWEELQEYKGEYGD